MRRIPSVLLLVAIVFGAWSLGHQMGMEQSDGLGRLAVSNEKIAASYERLSEQLKRVTPTTTD